MARPWLPTSSSYPIGLSDRVFSSSDFAVLVASLALGAPALIVGMELLGVDPGLGLTVSQLVLAAPLGIVFAAGLLIAAAWAAAENGVPAGLLLRPSLGVAGSWAATILQLMFLVAWVALELDFAGSAIVKALEALGVEGIHSAVAIGLIALAAAALLIVGLAWVTQIWLYRFAFWAALALTVVLAWRYLSLVDFTPLLDATPVAGNFWLGVDGVVVLGVIWFPIVADTARFTVAPTAAASGAGTGFSVAALALVLIGGLRAVAVELPGSDPAVLLVDGLSTLGAVVVVAWFVVAAIDQPFLLSFSGATALSTISDRFAGRIQSIILVAVGALVAFVVPMTFVRQVADLLVVLIAQMLAVLLADYYFVRHRYYETDDLYRRKGSHAGVNLYGLVAVLTGFVISAVIKPVGPDGWVSTLESIVPGDSTIAEAAGLPPTLISMLVAFVVYAGLGRWKIRDKETVSDLRV
jgi:purine-cytosine permease-like protein